MSLDLPRMKRIRLSARPLAQRIVGHTLLTPNYRLPKRVRIDLEGLENLPDEPVIFAMNHTDRYNYWPFQYQLWKQQSRFTATWVKGKYYENEVMARFMEWTNNIPTVSRGYLIARDFLSTLGRRPTESEYRALRHAVDSAAGIVPADAEAQPTEDLLASLASPRTMLGRPYDPKAETWAEAINSLFTAIMARFLALHDEAFALGLDLLIFPQGTRSKRLSRGHIGIAQVALHYGKTIVPVGCNGSDRCYPGGSPWAKGGHIVYRFGPPMTAAELDSWRPAEPFVPFSAAAEKAHRENFQGLADAVMDRIDPLLDAEYRFAEDQRSEGVGGSDRFL